METDKLMQNTETMTNTMTVNEQKVENNEKCMMENGNANGELTKPELIEMSTSTTSVKCCNGIFKGGKAKKICKEKPPQPQVMNGTANGNAKCYLGTLKAKFTSSNGKYQVNGKCDDVKKPEKIKQPMVFDDRDPFKINTNVKYEFLQVFAEPNSGTYSFNPTWSFTSRMYFNLKLFLYRIFSILVGIPCAFICAIFFAIFSVFQIWIFSPLLRLFKALFGLFRELWATVIDAVFGPIVQLFMQPRQTSGFNSQIDSQCPSSASSKSIYNEDVNVV